MTIALSLARYRFTFRVIEPLQLPEYAGSSLRGVFGNALMQLSGLSRNDVKQQLPLYIYSPYAEVFEPAAPQNGDNLLANMYDQPLPYIIEAPLGGEKHLEAGDLL